MHSSNKDSNWLQVSKTTRNATGEMEEILLNQLLTQEPTGFILRSLYGKDEDSSEITRRILEIIRLKKWPEESGLLKSLLSAASRIPPDSQYLNDPPTFRWIVDLQKHKIMERLDLKKETVSVYLPDGAYRKQMGDIPHRLRSIYYNALTFVGTICQDEHEESSWVFYGGHGIIEHMDFVDLFACATFAHDLPKSSKKIYFMHDIHDSPVSREKDVLKMIGEFDYYFAPSPSVIERIQKQIVQARDRGYLREKKEIGLIPGGYIKLDQNLKWFEKYKKEEKVIIHAPTVADADIEDYASLPRHSEGIIDALLENFPDYKVIFRPHPHTAESPPARRIAEKHKTNPRFVFDDNPSFYMSNYAQSTLMVTDFSGTAFTYAFTTLRPVIFYSHNEKAFHNNFDDFKYVDDRNKIGLVANNIDELIKKVRFLLDRKDTLASEIKKYRDSLLYNLGHAEEYFVKNIDHILKNQKHTDWKYAQADPLPPRLLEEGYKGFNIVHFRNQYFAISQGLGLMDLEKTIESDLDLDFECFIASTQAEARGYIDGINYSLQLAKQSQGNSQKIKSLEKIITEGEIEVKQLTRELADKNFQTEKLVRQMENSHSQIGNLSGELKLRDKWIDLLREKLKTAASQRDNLQKELKNIKSSFWYRFIK